MYMYIYVYVYNNNIYIYVMCIYVFTYIYMIYIYIYIYIYLCHFSKVQRLVGLNNKTTRVRYSLSEFHGFDNHKVYIYLYFHQSSSYWTVYIYSVKTFHIKYQLSYQQFLISETMSHNLVFQCKCFDFGWKCGSVSDSDCW